MSEFIIEQNDTQLLGTSSSIRYELSFENASRHIINIAMHIDDIDNQTIEVKSPVWIPGSYKVRDMMMHQGNVEVIGSHGEHIQWHWTSKSSLIAETLGVQSIVIRYTYYANDRGVRTSHVNRNHAYIMPVACLMYVEGRLNEIHHVTLHTQNTEWQRITTALSPVHSTNNNNEPAIYGALNYHILIDSPIEIGNHSVHTFTVAGSIHEVAIISNTAIDSVWLTGEIKRAVEIELDFWGDLPYDRYVFFLLVGEGLRGGLEHLRCNVSAVEPSAFLDKSAAQSMMSLLVHEFFHTWNVKRIRPIELGPFDYSQENYTSMLWLAEGFTSYFDDYLSYRCGFYSREEYLATLAQSHLGRLSRVPGRFAMSVKDSSYLAWIKLYAMSPDQHNRFPSYYTKGGIITLLLDMLIITKSNGTSKLEHAMKALWSLYKQDGQKGFTEDDIIDIIEKTCSVSIREELLHWLNGKDELPYNDIFSHLGLEWSNTPGLPAPETYGEFRPFCKKALSVFTGWSISEQSGRLFIREIEEGSPAAQAGIGIDDEIIAINGLRIGTAKMLMEAMNNNGIEKHAEVLAQCDGVIYTTSILPTLMPKYTITIKSSITQAQERLLNYWLNAH